MKQVYEAANVTDAHMIKDLLVRAGIPAHLHGEYLQGALGELPVRGMIFVQVPEADAARARQIIDDWTHAIPEPLDDDTSASASAPTVDRARPSALRTIAVFGFGIAVVRSIRGDRQECFPHTWLAVAKRSRHQRRRPFGHPPPFRYARRNRATRTTHPRSLTPRRRYRPSQPVTTARASSTPSFDSPENA